MSNPKRFAGAVAALLLLGLIGFIGLYILLQRAASRVASEADATGSAPASEQPGPPGDPATATEPGQGEEGTPAGQPAPSAEVAPATVAEGAPGSDAIDLSLDEPTLDKFLEVRRRMFERYEPAEDELIVLELDLTKYRMRWKQVTRRGQLILPISRARKEGLEATGLSETEYGRVAKVVYENWWRATAAGVNIDLKLSEARRAMADIDKQLEEAERHAVSHKIMARKLALEREIGRLEWARSYAARRLLATIPAATQRICENRAEEIDRYALKAMDMLTF
jgi:hypothetical protein